MKSQFLKIAGVKSEKAFYKKYPTEAAFFKAHPEAKKMANGGEQDRGQLKKLDDLTNFTNYNMPEAQFGLNLPDPFSFGKTTGALNTASPTSLGGLGAANPTADLIGGLRGAQRDSSGLGKLFGEYTTKGTIGGAAAKGTGSSASGYIDAAKNIVGGISAIQQEKKVRKQAKQDARLTDVLAQAATLPKEIIKREYVRPEDIIVQPGQLSPVYGTGTNILAAEDGAMIGGNHTEIMNTFAPNTIYSDMGYEPLNDSDQLKAYYHGGKMTKAQGGGIFDATTGFGQFMTGEGGQLLGNVAERVGTGGRGPSGSSQLGKGIGQAAGTAFGGPVGGIIGGTLGTLVGGLFGKKGAKETERYQQQAGQNISDIMYANSGVGLQNQYQSYMEDGGDVSDEYKWVSHSWQPQVIATFGEHKVKDLLQPPNDADMLRAGGHLRSYTPPSEQAMYTGREQFAMGGDLKVYRGEAETMSYNPYLPDGGETIMFRGPSHENGGMPIEYGSSPVEVEGGEPAVKLQDGTSGDSSLVVYGNLVNPKTGKKFKRDAEEISKNEAKQNKKINKASTGLDNLNVNSSFDKLGLDTYNAIITGANMKLKQYAEDKMDLAALQSAINDTAEEYGIIADDLAKGKIKPDTSKNSTAKNGKNLLKAAAGTEVNPVINTLLDLIKQKGYDYNVTSTIREGAKTAQGRKSRHASGEAADVTFPKLGSEAYNTILKDPEIAQFMLENGLTAINEYDPNTLSATKGTGPHIHFGFDKGTKAADKFRQEASSLYLQQPGPSTPKQGAQVSFEDYTYLKELYDAAKKQKKGPAVEKFQKEYSRIAPQFAQQVLGQYPVTAYGKSKGLKPTDVASNIDAIFGPRTERYMSSLNISPVKGVGTTNQGQPSKVNMIPFPTTTQTAVPKLDKNKFPWMDIANTIIGQVRPSDAEALDINQLTGELYALTNNQLEPVQAQKYNPQLLSPYDISLQDQLNANQATFNSLQRQIGSDPSALASLAAQKYDADSKILGEQMRINQAQKANIYNQNINTLNDAQLRNLATLDQQYVRQAQAKTATKATTQSALNSISSKYAQNKLDNRTLATYENLYNYRYDPSFRAQNMNPLAQFDTSTASSAEVQALADYKKAQEAKAAKEAKKTANSRNGSIVKALKNL